MTYAHAHVHARPLRATLRRGEQGEYLFDHRNANVSVDGQTFIEW